MSWNITHIIELAFGVALGGFITLGVNLYLQSRERRKEYAICNRNEIYIPLFDEIKLTHEKLDSFENPFSAIATLNSWIKFSPSTRLRVPQDLKEVIDKFHKTAKDYYEAYRAAERVLEKNIEKMLLEGRGELEKADDHLKRNIFETCKADFFAGEILTNKQHRLPLETILPLKAGSSLTFKSFYAKIRSSIKEESEIIELKHKRQQLIEITQDFERHLVSKIDYILKKFESKLMRV